MTAFTVAVLVLYFLPALLAASRRHHNTGAIIALNILLGWSVLGWIVAFVWALTNPVLRAASEPLTSRQVLKKLRSI